MLPIEPLSRAKSDEELTAICILARISHRDNAGAGMLQLAADLVVEGVAIDGAAAATGAAWVATLDHEIG